MTKIATSYFSIYLIPVCDTLTTVVDIIRVCISGKLGETRLALTLVLSCNDIGRFTVGVLRPTH
jgi:hypothetical protein